MLADRFARKHLNSPNNVVVSSDDAIWFTDPTYGILSNFEGYQAPREQAYNHVFRVDPVTGEIAAVITDFVQPNGIAFPQMIGGCMSPKVGLAMTAVCTL